MGPLTRYTLCDGVYLSENEVSKLIDESKPWKERKSIGFRFNPSDLALANIYVDKLLDRKDNFVLYFFKDIDVYDLEPSELSGDANEFGEGKMYFFTRIKSKHSTNRSSTGRTMFARTAGGGCWKKNGKISDITADVEHNSDKLIVRKTPLAFFKKDKKTCKEERTAWLMEEYMLNPVLSPAPTSYENGENSGEKSGVLALCVIYLKGGKQQNQNCVSENESCDRRKERNSEPDMKGGSSQNLASEPSSSLRPPIQSSLDPSKGHCTYSVSSPETFGDFSPSESEWELLRDCVQSGNEHGSNQQQPNSHGSGDPILQPHGTDSGMGCYSSQQNPTGTTSVADQPLFNHHSVLENMFTPCASDTNRNDFSAKRQEKSPFSASVECSGLNYQQLSFEKPSSDVASCSINATTNAVQDSWGRSHESSTRIDYSSNLIATATGFEQGPKFALIRQQARPNQEHPCLFPWFQRANLL